MKRKGKIRALERRTRWREGEEGMEGDCCGPEAGLVGRRAVQGAMTQRGKNAGEPEGEKKQMGKEKAAKPSGWGRGARKSHREISGEEMQEVK